MPSLFLTQLQRLRRVDELALPALKNKLKKTTLKIPDPEKDLIILNMLKQIGVVVEKQRGAPDLKLQKLKKYLGFLETTHESLLLSLKRESYEAGLSESNTPKNLEEEEQAAAREQKLLEDAYKNVEISEEAYVAKFQQLRKAYWGVKISVAEEYDFGLLYLDCSRFKKLVSKHLDKLIVGLTEHIVGEFLTKAHGLFS